MPGVQAAYDRDVASDDQRPGLRKTSQLPLLQRRVATLWRSADYRLRELFEAADVMSEGATRKEREGEFYYGTTSVLLPLESAGGQIPDENAELARSIVSCDPHARVRAIRIACREAQVRAAAPLGRVRAELVVRSDERGVRIDIEVEARIFPQRISQDESDTPAGPARIAR